MNTEDRWDEALLKWARRRFPEQVPPFAFEFSLNPIIRDPRAETLDIDYQLVWHTPGDEISEFGDTGVLVRSINDLEFHQDFDSLIVEILEYYPKGEK